MKTWRVVTAAAVAAMLMAGMQPSPAAAQLGGLKKKLKAKLVEVVIEKTADPAEADPDTAAASGSGVMSRATGSLVAKKPMPGTPTQPGPRFTEYTLEITPELLDRLEKGLAAEQAVQQEIDRKVGKVLTREQYDQCFQAVVASPEGQKVYMASADLINGDASQEQLRKASQELGRRFEELSKPKCGLDPMKAAEVREAHREQLHAAAPEATGLTVLQLSILKERILPLCTALDALKVEAGEARIPTGSEAIFWVYTQGEVAALQPRCAKLAPAIREGA